MPWYSRGPSDAVPVPILGPDIIDPRQLHMIERQNAAPADETLATEAEA
jgi:NADH-quinone oxidoreductase subunit B